MYAKFISSFYNVCQNFLMIHIPSIAVLAQDKLWQLCNCALRFDNCPMVVYSKMTVMKSMKVMKAMKEKKEPGNFEKIVRFSNLRSLKMRRRRRRIRRSPHNIFP